MIEAKKCKKARAFQLTINDVDAAGDVFNYLRGLQKNYMIACREKAPSTGHEHIHVYVQFPTPHALSLKKVGGAHIEVCRGSPEQNIAYVKKDGDVIVEEGTPRLCYVPSIKDAKAMDSDVLQGLNLNFYNVVQKIEAEKKKYISPMDYYKNADVFYVYGESGAGKTKWCINDMVKNKVEKFNEVKYDGSFWHGVTEDCAVCLYDDWRDSHMKPAEFINFIDYNKHVMNVKGGSVRNNYSKIYITSVQPPEEIYKNINGEPRKQWERRMKIVHIIGEQGNSLGVL